ncbi:MAG: endonuclease/exonuclease/phosphatase family protein [Nitrospirota bacterium]
MIGRVEWIALELRRLISRSEWMARWLKLPKSEGTGAQPGLVLIQIDGLARSQLEAALRTGKMPFVKCLLKKEGYRLHTLYSGLPSNTPAFQGELFYGVKSAVPAFGYQDRLGLRRMSLYEPGAAVRAQEFVSSASDGPPLLDGGSAFSDFFSGGASESHFCAATIGWNAMLRAANPLTLAVLLAWHGWSVIRVGTLLLVETGLAVADFVRGVIAGQDLWKELKFVPSRVAVSILLRELVTIGATIDAVRGLPIVHLNYLGYDEQAHRRGPSSAFAHWTLKGIDDAIKRVWRAARRSSRRDYDIWIYSDHGQEQTSSYQAMHGRTVQEAVAEVMGTRRPMDAHERKRAHGTQLMRASWLGAWARWLPGGDGRSDASQPGAPVVMALGPVGHVYCDPTVAPHERGRLARALVERAKIPLVLAPGGPETARAWTAAGEFTLPDDGARVLGEKHPFLDEAAQDLVALCHHPDSGTFVISGWSPENPPLTFPIENGAHGGPGVEETRAFALLPATAPVADVDGGYLRALDVREGALQLLGRSSKRALRGAGRRRAARRAVRVMTYNVHSCRGMDGRLSPERIARVITHYDPDIVALQELDVGRSRTGDIDQAKVIARALDMEYHFHPAFRLAEEQYGDAVLSRHPLQLVKAGALPSLPNAPYLEPRGAIWVSIAINGSRLQLINTHLGLSRRERLMQVEALLGSGWLAHPDCLAPVILCGDFNALPGSIICQKLEHGLRDVQRALSHHTPKATWFGRYPINRIDHIFIDETLSVQSCDVPRTTLTRVASDHLPLIVDLVLP